MKVKGKRMSDQSKTPLRLTMGFCGIGAIEQALLRMHIDHE